MQKKIFAPLSSREFQKEYGLPGMIGLINKCHYIGGVPIFDEAVEKGKEYYVQLNASKEALQVTFNKNIVSRLSIGIPKQQVNKIVLHDKEQIFKQKENNALGSALVGGLLFGGMGAIIGAAAGSGGIEKAKMPDLVVEITVADEGAEKTFVLGAKYESKKEIIKFFQKHVPDKFNILEEANLDMPKYDLLSQLEKLGKLKEEGILTDVEFAQQKAKLLQ